MQAKKFFLGLMPFWSPLSPPLGISLLKSYLKEQGYDVVIQDFNVEDQLWEVIDRYFKILGEAVPENKQGNFYMVGFDVISNHLMAYVNKKGENEYCELVKILAGKNYNVEIDKNTITALDKIVCEFYAELSAALLKVLDREKPDLFGLSVYSTSLGPSVYAFRLVKEKFPGIKTIMGGGIFADHLALNSPNFPVFLKKTSQYIDTIIVGEGELLLQNYLSGELEDGKRVYSLDNINRKNLDLSKAAIPDFSDLNLSSYSQMAAYATRSCPFQCGFCSETVQWGRFREKRGERIVAEIAAIRQKYGGKLFMFGDSLMNSIIDDFSTNLIKSKTDIFWDGYLRADPEVCEIDKVALWRQAGLYRARLGVESGSQHVLDLMKKRVKVEIMKKAISNLANFGIKTTTYWIIGYPGETEDDFLKTLELLTELKGDIYEADWHPFYFFPQGQVNSKKWTGEHDIELLYPEEYSDMLLTQTWILKTDPERDVIIDRLNRFGAACRKLGIPNPSSMMELYQAEKRWKDLHPKTGPTILDLHNYKHT